MRYEDEWWSVELPAGWSGAREDDTALLAARDGPGLLQIRAFRSDGRDIDNDDLRSLARPHVEAGAQLHRAEYGAFQGFSINYRADDQLWYEWWLRAGRVALHATYHCPFEERTRERPTVAAILDSLRPAGG